MSPLSNIEGRQVIKFAENLGYKYIRQRGSHMRYKNDMGSAITIHVKGKKVIKPGKLKGLLNDMNVTPTVLFEFLNITCH